MKNMKDPIVLSNTARRAALESLGVVLGNEFAPNAIASNNLGAYHGQVCLANDSLLRQSEYIEELTTFAISYDGMVGNRLTQLRDLLAPPRPSNSRGSSTRRTDWARPNLVMDAISGARL